MPTVINAAGSTPLAHPLSTFSVLVDGAGILTNDGAGNLSWAAGGGAETDPIVGAITGIVKSDGAGNISAAEAGTDYIVDINNIDSEVIINGIEGAEPHLIQFTGAYNNPGDWQGISWSDVNPGHTYEMSEIRSKTLNNLGTAFELWACPDDGSMITSMIATFAVASSSFVGDLSAANLSAANLSIDAPVNTSAASLLSSAIDSDGEFTWMTLGKAESNDQSAGFTYFYDNIAENQRLQINFFGGAVLGINLLGNGNVGIGTASPATALDVNGNGTFTGTLTASNLSGTNTGDQDLSGYALTSSLGTAAFAATGDFDPAGAAAAVTPATLGLVIGTNVQAYDADLTTWAGVTPGTGVTAALAVNTGSAGSVVVTDGSNRLPAIDGSQLTGISAGLSRGKIFAPLLTA